MSPTRRLLLLPFWLAVVLAVLGDVITFVPGAEREWFLVVAGLSASGLLIPKAAYRISAVVLVVLALAAAYSEF